MRKIFFTTLLSMSLFLSVVSLNAYCIHNNTDAELNVIQTSGGRGWPFTFNENIRSSGQKCCNWKNRDCNTSGKRDSLVGFKVQYRIGSSPFEPVCFNFKIKAGGDLIIEGKNGNYKCRAVDY